MVTVFSWTERKIPFATMEWARNVVRSIETTQAVGTFRAAKKQENGIKTDRGWWSSWSYALLTARAMFFSSSTHQKILATHLEWLTTSMGPMILRTSVSAQVMQTRKEELLAGKWNVVAETSRKNISTVQISRFCRARGIQSKNGFNFPNGLMNKKTEQTGSKN